MFVLVFASVLLLSLVYKNVVWAILMFFLLWWYFYYSTINNQIISITIDPNHLIIGNKNYSWRLFTGYVLEIYPDTQELKNIVFVSQKNHMIYTFDDSIENISAFLSALESFLPMLDTYDQWTFEKMSRKMKL